MVRVLHPAYLSSQARLDEMVISFDSAGEKYGDQDRNELKLFKLGQKTLNVKSFKVPNLLNQVAYRFFRKSKARRSFEHACNLIGKGIGTPHPVAYYEFPDAFLFKRSFYVCEHIDYDLTYRELTEDHNYPDHENILRAFTRFTFKLHENKVEFLDHSPGNTLVKKTGDEYEFFLVDLNRMRFGELSFEDRIRNFSRLSPHKSIVEIMSDEYAKCIGDEKERVFNLMWQYTNEFQAKYWRKQRFKKRFRFWMKQS